jgi:SAM-dependent methyltransferase
LSDVERNVELWTRTNAEYTGGRAREQWLREDLLWGVWGIPESRLRALPPVEGLDVVELGCGTAYVSAWLTRQGARPVGVDPTPAQLETARELQVELGLEFPLVQAGGEEVPLPSGSFDLAVSEYGASIWADPYRWVPEASRLLRPGGRLVFLRNSTIFVLCSPDEGPADAKLVRPLFGMHRFDAWDGVEFHLPHGEWIRLLRVSGFEVEDLVEIQAPPDAETHSYYDYVTPEWGRRWPAEEIWKARKRA